MQLAVGQIVDGKITGITNFGVFIEFDEGKSGMVHISEVSHSFVNDINELYKVGDSVKAKILNISDNGKISLSIKQATPKKSNATNKERYEKRMEPSAKIDSSYTWTPKKVEPASFEEMMNRFKQTSDEKFSDLKRKNPDSRRSKRGAGK